MARKTVANKAKSTETFVGVDRGVDKDETVAAVVTVARPNIVEIGTYRGRKVRVMRKVADLVEQLETAAIRQVDKKYAAFIAGYLRNGFPLDTSTELRCKMILRRAAR